MLPPVLRRASNGHGRRAVAQAIQVRERPFLHLRCLHRRAIPIQRGLHGSAPNGRCRGAKGWRACLLDWMLLHARSQHSPRRREYTVPTMWQSFGEANAVKVYRICDVIRGAHSLTIAVGRPPNDHNNITTRDLMLQQWGRRIWTFPEVLLAPAGKKIAVYMRGADIMRPTEIAKNQFAADVWPGDAQTARQVSEHFESPHSPLIGFSWWITMRATLY